MALLDTHVVLWWATDRRRLSQRAAREIARADTIWVSPLTCLEIATLVRRGRIRLDRDAQVWIGDLLAQERVAAAEVRPSVAVSAGALDDAFPGDPVDRVLYATARDLGVPFVSMDRRLREWARAARDVSVVW